MNLINKPNFFVFTGGPGTGKTTLLNELSYRGYTVVPEVARAIIKKQYATGGNATHMGNRTLYCELMLKQSISDFITSQTLSDIVFFDRGIPDLYCYLNEFCEGVTTEIVEVTGQYRYSPQVFLFPPWSEIYCHDEERKQNFQEATNTYYAVKKGYAACGYQLIEVPKLSITARADFILKFIQDRSK